jgi:hypothetical protein
MGHACSKLGESELPQRPAAADMCLRLSQSSLRRRADKDPVETFKRPSGLTLIYYGSRAPMMYQVRS